jgi:cell wall-associated NlpC family hydrolase
MLAVSAAAASIEDFWNSMDHALPVSAFPHVPRDQLLPRDIIFFRGVGHEGVYIGGGKFIQAPHTGDVVKISSLDDPGYADSYDGAVCPWH